MSTQIRRQGTSRADMPLTGYTPPKKHKFRGVRGTENHLLLSFGPSSAVDRSRSIRKDILPLWASVSSGLKQSASAEVSVSPESEDSEISLPVKELYTARHHHRKRSSSGESSGTMLG